MAKRRRLNAPRQVLGVITNEQGGRIEIRNPSIYGALVFRDQKIELLEKLVTEATERGKRHKEAFDQLSSRRLVRFFAWLRLIRLNSAAPKVEAPKAEAAPAS